MGESLKAELLLPDQPMVSLMYACPRDSVVRGAVIGTKAELDLGFWHMFAKRQGMTNSNKNACAPCIYPP